MQPLARPRIGPLRLGAVGAAATMPMVRAPGSRPACADGFVEDLDLFSAAAADLR
jgi:hypothetical protein